MLDCLEDLVCWSPYARLDGSVNLEYLPQCCPLDHDITLLSLKKKTATWCRAMHCILSIAFYLLHSIYCILSIAFSVCYASASQDPSISAECRIANSEFLQYLNDIIIPHTGHSCPAGRISYDGASWASNVGAQFIFLGIKDEKEVQFQVPQYTNMLDVVDFKVSVDSCLFFWFLCFISTSPSLRLT